MSKKGSGPGVRVHAKGYLQVTRRGPYYGWLEHRRVVYEACLESPHWRARLNGKLPEGLTVEHLDHKRQHNCLENLLLLDKRIHDHLSITHSANLRRVQAKVEGWGWVADPEAPDWVNQLEE